MKLALILLPLALLQTCSEPGELPPVPPVTVSPQAPKEEAKRDEAKAQKESKAAAAVESAALANQGNAEGPPKQAVSRELAVAQAALPPPSAEDRAEAQARREAVLSGNLERAAALYAKTEASISELLSRLSSLEKSLQEAREASARAMESAVAERDRRIEFLREENERMKMEASAKERFWRTMILTGLGSLLIIAAILSAALRASIPAFGPLVTVGLGFAGVCLIVLNVVASQLERQLEAHPWILWAGIGLALAAAIGAVALMTSNHLHASRDSEK